MTIFQVLLLLSLIPSSVFSAKSEGGPVTCGSVIKLIHKETGNNLHSHAIAWGSGSGQQSVTTTGTKNDKGSLWIVKESSKSDTCEVGVPIKCGTHIRLEHADTGKNLHSHLFKSAISGNQEVSGFGEKGNGDTGDNWEIICESASATFWERNKPISLSHIDTGKFLSSAGQFQFNQQNCGGQCPIMGQTEVSCAPKKDVRSKWQTGQGVYFPVGKSAGGEDDEL